MRCLARICWTGLCRAGTPRQVRKSFGRERSHLRASREVVDSSLLSSLRAAQAPSLRILGMIRTSTQRSRLYRFSLRTTPSIVSTASGTPSFSVRLAADRSSLIAQTSSRCRTPRRAHSPATSGARSTRASRTAPSRRCRYSGGSMRSIEIGRPSGSGAVATLTVASARRKVQRATPRTVRHARM